MNKETARLGDLGKKGNGQRERGRGGPPRSDMPFGKGVSLGVTRNIPVGKQGGRLH